MPRALRRRARRRLGRRRGFGREKTHARGVLGRMPRSNGGCKDGNAYLRVLLGCPFLLLDGGVHLVPPSLRALLTGLSRELRRDERPAVAVNLLWTSWGECG